jgi:hypothetical protein
MGSARDPQGEAEEEKGEKACGEGGVEGKV